MARWKDRPGSRRDIKAAVREFVLEDRTIPPGGWVRNRELLSALITYLRIGARFRKQGLNAAASVLPDVSGPRARLDPDDPAAIFCARAASVRLLGLARTVAGAHLCLHEALAVTGGLRCLGFEVQAVIGYPVVEPRYGDNAGADLHAWPMLGRRIIADRIGDAPPHFVEIVRYPASLRSAE